MISLVNKVFVTAKKKKIFDLENQLRSDWPAIEKNVLNALNNGRFMVRCGAEITIPEDKSTREIYIGLIKDRFDIPVEVWAEYRRRKHLLIIQVLLW